MSTPTQLHASQSIAAMRAGKHCFAEIPMADSLEDAEAMVAAQESTGVVGLVGHVRRFNPSHQYIRNKIEAGEFSIQQMDAQTYFFRRSNLNAKGEPLAEADLVRNYLFMRIADPEEQKVAYQDLWRPMEEELGNELSNFMWRFLTKDGTFVRQASIYEVMKNRFSHLPQSSEVIDVLSDMHTYAGYYLRLIKPENEPNSDIRRRLARINRWEIKTAYPFLLAIYNDLEKGYISVQEMCRILGMIESFVIRRFFCRVPTNALNRIFIALYNSLDKTDIVSSTEKQLVTQDWPDDALFMERWSQLPIYNSGTAKCRHILESIEETLTHNNEPVDVTHDRITIEHVMPQTLSEAWEQTLGDQATQIHNSYLHTIGNLTLTGKNGPMGNDTFPKKQVVFAESNFALNKHFRDKPIWNEVAIQERGKDLAKVATQIWQRVDIDVATVKRQDPTGHKPTQFTLFDEIYEVTTWREVLLKTVETLALLHGAEE
ncbi:MAG: DUF1524 domain-containing protein, partial [Chloroflexota bacterium]